jgi:hypothetical protein
MTVNQQPIQSIPDTSDRDSAIDVSFREIVRQYSGMGYGRMSQIVSEEWRRAHPRSGGLLFLCPKCDELYIYDWRMPFKTFIKRFFGQ